MSAAAPERLRVVLVSGLSGGGKASVMRALEDAGYEAVDNPPLPMLEDMIVRGERKLAIGIDARTRGFEAGVVLAILTRLRANPRLRPELIYTWADETTLLRRYTETRRRHPLAPQGRIVDGIEADLLVTSALREAADLVIDTSDLPLAVLGRLIERHFGAGSDGDQIRLVVSLISFAFPKGVPREADLVFDARFLRNPYYDPRLRSRTGMDPEVQSHVAEDPDHARYLAQITGMLDLVLPRFVQEGKKYTTVAIGCTGGRHRSVCLIEEVAAHLRAEIAKGSASGVGSPGGSAPLAPTPGAPAGPSLPGMDWRLLVTHRELARDGWEDAYLTDRPVPRRDDGDNDGGTRSPPGQALEA